MLRALCEYYDCLRRQPDSGLISDMYSKVTVSFNLVLRQDGTIHDILPYTQEIIFKNKRKSVGRDEIFPFRNSISGIAAETIEHREKYLFGLEYDSSSQTFIVSRSSALAFEKNKELNLPFLDPIDTPLTNAYKKFMSNWNPESETDNTFLTKMGREYSGAKFVITLAGCESQPLNRLPEITKAWEAEQRQKTSDNNTVFGQCAICGENLPIARTHDAIGGIRGGLSTGVNLVCFNNSAFESYGKRQSYNSCISVKMMKKYTKAMNFLASSSEHKQYIDDMTVLFWANTSADESPYLDAFINGLFDSGSDENQILKSVMEKMSQGIVPDIEGIDFSTDFYIMGVKPNSSRLSVKFFERSSFGTMMNNIAKHCIDIRFSDDDRQLALWQICSAVKSPNSSDNVNPELSSKVFTAILKGTAYPEYLLQTIVRRSKTDQDNPGKNFFAVNRTRARIIKACLLRKKYIGEGEYCMLHENSPDIAYNLGRLFAVLEKTQTDALGEINVTIKDRFFSSACSAPYLVFPRLLRLTQSHLGKLEDGNRIYKDRLIQDILSKLDTEFPKTLTIEKQGMFILGYYQQKQKFYEKNEKEEDKS